jgi:hypothetical protein
MKNCRRQGMALWMGLGLFGSLMFDMRSYDNSVYLRL